MLTVTLVKWRQKPSTEVTDRMTKFIKNPPPGVKLHSIIWTLGRYDVVITAEFPNEIEAMKMMLAFSDAVSTETLVGVPRDEALKLLK